MVAVLNGLSYLVRCNTRLFQHLRSVFSPLPLFLAPSTPGRFASNASSQPDVFDRSVKRKQRNRAALSPDCRQYEQLREEVAWQVSDRIYDINRKFPMALDFGCGRGYLGKHVDKEAVQTLVQCDMSEHMLASFDPDARDLNARVHCDEEGILPFNDNSFDLVASSMNMHWINDIPGTFREILRVLKPDGVFVCSMLGGDTLYELRGALLLAEQERLGGFSAHMSPLIDVRDVGGLLTGSGFTLTTVDLDELKINFPSSYELVQDLRGMGESNAALNRKGFISREVLLAVSGIYQAMYGNPDGSIPATFQLVHMVGWKPHTSQPQSLERGTAKYSLKDIPNLPKPCSST